MKEAVSFDDVLLTPGYSDITSRSEIDAGSTLGQMYFSLPVISSPMDTVTEVGMSQALSTAGGVGIIHRYNSIEEQAGLVANLRTQSIHTGAAIGITGDFLARAETLVENDVSFLCVDVAHGHHALVKGALTSLREALPSDTHIMAGNVATLDGFNDLADWGADSIRVGIGGGSICSTRIQTGHGIPTLQSVIECAKSDRNANLIADGGFKTSGDIVKALAAGADFVMLGSMLAGTEEAPGEIIYNNGAPFKVYRGMASKEAQIEWRGRFSSNEGVTGWLPFKGSVGPILEDLERGIRSGLSYSGARDLLELRAKHKFIRQTSAGQTESGTRIQRKL